MTLGGDGGDELFGARAYLLADRLRAGHPLQAVALARELPGAGDHPARRDVARIVAELAVARRAAISAAQRRWARCWRGARRRAGCVRTPRAICSPPRIRSAWKRLAGPRWWADVAHGLTRRVEEIGVFEHQRRRAASAGVEARHPLFDLELVELSLRQPPLATFDRYRSRPILRSAMAGLLPDAVRLRPQKALFDSVLVDCFDGADGAAARGLLSDPDAEIRAYVDQSDLQRALFEASKQRVEQPFRWMWQLWRLTTAECWLRAQYGGGVETLRDGLSPGPPSVSLRPARNPVKALA